MLKLLKHHRVLLLLGGAVILLDQATKAWIENNLAFTAIWTPIPALPWLQITNWHNRGMAFGLGQGWGTVLFALGLVYAAAVVIFFPAISRSGWAMRWGMAIQWGGALGNLLDRWRQGYVTDFIAVGHFPVFNLADAAITLSVVFLLLGELFSREEAAEEAPAETADTPAEGAFPPPTAPEETPHGL